MSEEHDLISSTMIVDEVKKDDEKKKREKREFLDPETKTVPVGTSVFNNIFALLSRECQCRPEVTPRLLAELASRWAAQVAIVIGENNREFNTIIFDAIDAAIAQVSTLKLKQAPIESCAQVFKYETKRPKRERTDVPEGSDGTKPPKAKKSKKEDASLLTDTHVKTTKFDSEGNVIQQ